MWTKKSFTLIEMVIVLIIVTILAALAWHNYSGLKEKALDREAKTSLALIQVAERNYRMEHGYYYPSSDRETNIANINSNLKLSLLVISPKWTITLDTRTAGSEFATAARSGRTWTIYFSKTSSEVPSCTGTGCS